MATVHLLHAGYIRDEGTRVGSSITLVRDGECSIITDPGFVARRSLILDPLAALGVDPESVSHVFLSHHHPDHTVNAALFPNAEIVDFWARYKDDLWLDNGGDGWQMTPNAQLWLTPGHTEEDASLIVSAEDGTYAMTHLWWKTDRTPVDRSVRAGPGNPRSPPGARPRGRRRRHPGPRRGVPRRAVTFSRT